MKAINKFLILFSLTTSTFLFSSYTVVEDQLTETIKSPQLQNIERKKLSLGNGLQVLVISDPQAKKSGASLAVGLGWNHEPRDCVGLAHFTEHMLFMGTQKYPDENEYHDFMKSRGGMENAYTSSKSTVYTFEIANDHALEALDRFASCVSEPLFNESSLERERQAVNEEFLFRINKDSRRLYSVISQTQDENSNAHICRCGTKETLSKISRDQLVDWYQRNYSANLMRLVVYSATPMDALIEQIDASFSKIPNKNVVVDSLQGPLTQEQFLGKNVYIKPIQDLKQVSVFWELPKHLSRDEDYHTSKLITAALEEVSPKSLATRLKDEGWINSIDAGIMSEDRDVAFFVIGYELTDAGLQHYDDVMNYTYAAIHSLQKNGIARYRFDEMAALAKLNFQYQSRPEVYEFVQFSSAALLNEDLATFPAKTIWPTKYDSHRIQEFLSCLTPEKSVSYIFAPADFHSLQYDRVEEMAQIAYTVSETDANTMEQWASVDMNQHFALAPPNPFMPSHLEIVTSAQEIQETEQPVKIFESENCEIHFKADGDYQVPEVNYALYFQSPAFENSSRNSVMNSLYLLSVSDELSQLIEQGQAAGLDADVNFTSSMGLHIKVSGYSQKAKLFLTKVIELVQSHQPKEQDFERYCDFLARSYQNTLRSPPFQQSRQTMKAFLIQNYTTPEVAVEELSRASFSDFQNHTQSIFSKIYIRGLIYGNVQKSDAQNFAVALNENFVHVQPYPLKEQHKVAILDYQADANPSLYIQETDQVGSASNLTICHGKLNQKDRACYAVFGKAISGPFFDTLRTKQQVGYIVAAFPLEIEQNCFSTFLSQSNVCSTRDLLARYELFNEHFLSSLGTEAFNEDKFQLIKSSLIDQYQQPPVSISDKGAELASLGFKYHDYDLKNRRVKALQNLSFEDFVLFCHQALGKSNNKRLAVLINGDMSSNPTISYSPIMNINQFKAQSVYLSVIDTEFSETGP